MQLDQVGQCHRHKQELQRIVYEFDLILLLILIIKLLLNIIYGLDWTGSEKLDPYPNLVCQ